MTSPVDPVPPIRKTMLLKPVTVRVGEKAPHSPARFPASSLQWISPGELDDTCAYSVSAVELERIRAENWYEPAGTPAVDVCVRMNCCWVRMIRPRPPPLSAATPSRPPSNIH